MHDLRRLIVEAQDERRQDDKRTDRENDRELFHDLAFLHVDPFFFCFLLWIAARSFRLFATLWAPDLAGAFY